MTMRRMTSVMMLICAALVVGCSPGMKAMKADLETPQVVYISAGNSKQIGVYDVDNASGRLTSKQTVTTEGAPGPLAVSPDRKFLYAALRDRSEAATYAINPETGELNLIGTTPLDGSATYIATDDTGRYLLAAYYGDGKIASFPIGEDGIVQSPPLQVTPTDKNAHSIHTDQSNRIAYVPHTGPNAVYQFMFDEKTGQLEANQPVIALAPIEPSVAGPRHYAYHPKREVVYFVNELGSSVTARPYDKRSGTLGEPLQTLSTLPADFAGKNTCADIHVSADGRFVYASNRGHDSIAVYEIDGREGALTLVEVMPTEKTPRAFALDNTGQYLYAAGQGSGKLAAYRRYETSGRLFPIATYDVGQGPAWVTVLSLPR